MTMTEILRINTIATGRECPACGERGGCEDNGKSGVHLTYLCTKCGEQWDAEEWFAKLPEGAHELMWG